MSKKNLLFITAFLVVIALFVQLYTKKDKRREDSPIGKPLAGIGLVESIDEIVIAKGETTLHLHKKSNGWVITEKNEFPANTQKLVELLDTVTTYRLSALITKDEGRLAHFKLRYRAEANSPDETTGSELTLKSKGKAVFKMVAGKNRDSVSSNPNLAARPDGTYVRIGESPAVYLIKENFSFNPQTDEWIRKALITMKTDQIKTVRFESPSSRFRFARKAPTEKLLLEDLKNSETIDEQAVKDMLTELETFSIENAISRSDNPVKRLDLKSEVSVMLFDNTTLNFQILVKTEKIPLEKKPDDEKKTYYANILTVDAASGKSDWLELQELGKTWLFELETWQAKTWLKTRKGFIKTKDKS
ncbi:MAG: DUF4340 domain-containing protein [bacterium]